MADGIRRIYIIPKSMKAKDVIEVAGKNNCPEIVRGIPPRLSREIREEDLPMIYEEIVPESPPARDALAEIDNLVDRLKKEGINLD